VNTGLSRRTLLKSSAVTGLIYVFQVPVLGAAQIEQGDETLAGRLSPNAFIRIDRSGATTLVMPQVEMGQGVDTSLAMVLAEELDADFSLVTLRHAPPDEKLYANPALGVQATGSSTSIRAFWLPLRHAGAATRALLVQAAAERWSVAAHECTTSSGRVSHAASGRSVGYGQLVDAAAALPPVAKAPIKDAKEFSLIGRPIKRLDAAPKVDGHHDGAPIRQTPPLDQWV
jgi:isoquinoline 1-oxidoreductase subunit beta